MEPQVEPIVDTGERSAHYQNLLLALLLPAALFNSYDGQLRALLLHQIQQNFHASVASLGLINIPIGAGQFVAFFFVLRADRWGRRPVLVWSIVGYTLFTSLTACSWDIWSFAAFQFGAQVFIGAEFGVAVTLLAEEVPADKRGRSLSKLLVFSPLGAIMAGLLLAVGMLHNPIGWRLFYLVATVPLVIAALMRRRLKESRAFVATRQELSSNPASFNKNVSFSNRFRESLNIWTRGSGKFLAAMCAIAFLQALPASGAIGWWSYYAEHQRHLSVSLVGIFFAAAAGISLAGYFLCGRLMDKLGRRPTVIVYIVGATIFAVGAFQASTPWLMLVLLMGTAFFGVGIAPVLSALAAELFPTDNRARASAWIRNGAGNTGSVLGPAVVGLLGSTGALIGNVGDTVSLLALVGLPIVFIVWRSLPETKGVGLVFPMDPDADRLSMREKMPTRKKPEANGE